ncbi:MAG: nickel pincer cofactor biosynthesis protein LarC, partial [Gemmatimonadales bacterium]
MRIAIVDPAAGISGDMTLGALLDAGVDRSWLESLPARVGFPSVRVFSSRVTRCSVSASKIDFEIRESETGGHGRHVGELIDIVRKADVSERVRAQASHAFELLGQAEGRVHGVPPQRVHLHEVGAVDAVLDIVGAIEGFELLGVERIYNLPVAIGNGWVEAAHGKLPIPAPATIQLLEGIDVATGGPITGEATTPTGAALLRVLSEGPPPTFWRPQTVGWGAGSRDPAAYPDVLRLIVAEASAEAGTVDVIATDIDDLAPEYIEPLRQSLFAAGALDCQMWPTHGKKGRLGVRVEVLAPTERTDTVVGALFDNSTTAGVRRWQALRSTLPRQEFVVELAPGVRVRIKVTEGPSGTRLKSEYDDVIAAGNALGRPALEVAREA